jgi:adenylyltransferase/sulfurtransferase
MTLGRDELVRYSRHIMLPEVGTEGQERLKAARVLLVGAGGLGSPAALYLAAAGIGTLGVVDFDTIDLTNLQRQVLYGTDDVGRPKLETAQRRLRQVNPHVTIEPHETRLSAANALELVRAHDLVVDGTDNFTTRYLVNDACVLTGKPNVYGSIFRFDGQASVFATADGPCYRCLFPEPPPPELVPSCAEGGVLGVLPGLVGMIQATEAVKLILGIGKPLIGRLLLVDALTMEFRSVALRRDPRCPACGTREIREVVEISAACAVPAAAQTAPDEEPIEITPAEVRARLQNGGGLCLVDVREPFEWEIARLPDATLIPLGTLAEQIGSLDRERDTVVYCKSGRRSAVAVQELREAGFRRVWSLAGGIIRWRKEVDPSLAAY